LIKDDNSFEKEDPIEYQNSTEDQSSIFEHENSIENENLIVDENSIDDDNLIEGDGLEDEYCKLMRELSEFQCDTRGLDHTEDTQADTIRQLNHKPICGNCNQSSSQCLNDTQVDLSRCRVRRGTHVKDGDDCVTIKKIWFTKRIGSFSDFYIDFVDSSRVVIDINGQTDLVYSCKCCR